MKGAPALALARRGGLNKKSGGGIVVFVNADSSTNRRAPKPSSSNGGSRRPLNAPPSAALSRSGGATYERVLRYPDGLERRIRYPVGNTISSSSSFEDKVAESDTEWTPPSPWQMQESGSGSGATTATTATAVAAARERKALRRLQQKPSAPLVEQVEEEEDVVERKDKQLLPLSPSSFVSPLPSTKEKDKERKSVDDDVDEKKKTSSLPSTPAELLRLARSTERLAAAKADDELLSTSYKVLDGCPWPVPRTLFFLATPPSTPDEDVESPSSSSSSNFDANDETATPLPPASAGLAYSMRVRRSSPSATSELSKLLGKSRSRPDGRGPLIDVSSLTDGVVAFEREEDAAAFAEQLSFVASSSSKGDVASVVGAASSHELFRATNDAKAVVVLVRRPATSEATEDAVAVEGGTERRRRDSSDARKKKPPLLLGPLPDPSALAAALRSGKQGELEP